MTALTHDQRNDLEHSRVQLGNCEATLAATQQQLETTREEKAQWETETHRLRQQGAGRAARGRVCRSGWAAPRGSHDIASQGAAPPVPPPLAHIRRLPPHTRAQ